MKKATATDVKVIDKVKVTRWEGYEAFGPSTVTVWTEDGRQLESDTPVRKGSVYYVILDRERKRILSAFSVREKWADEVLAKWLERYPKAFE